MDSSGVRTYAIRPYCRAKGTIRRPHLPQATQAGSSLDRVDVFGLGEVAASLAAQDYPYLEFLRKDSLSAGVYSLRVGDKDRQRPHGEDEVYYVISGRAKVRIGDEERGISLGDTIFVAKTVEHRFFDIEEDLLLLVIFAPPESSGG